jgi:hypothetical protein
MPAHDQHEFRQLLLAKHLEVFVPKPKTRELEANLLEWLDHLLLETKIPREDNDEILLVDGRPGILDKLQGKRYWENIIYGYSTYLTDGHFVDLDPKNQERSVGKYIREQTLVIKFLLTNYSTNIYRDFVSIPTTIGEQMAFVPAYAYPSLKESKPTFFNELYFTHLHYTSITEHIIDGIEKTVLWREAEVWAHSWYTVLDRRSMSMGRAVPIVRNDSDKDKRYGPRSHEVMCVMDYLKVPQ